MPHPSARTEILIGPEGIAELASKHVLVAGLGGVGSYAAEALCRAGIGKLTLLDNDVVGPSNINRQLVALHSTIGQAKTEIMGDRLRDIHPQVELILDSNFLQPTDAADYVDGAGFDFVADCIDSIACKSALVSGCQKHKVPVISAMGAGNRIDPTRVRVTRLDKTLNCPLAREMRGELRKQKSSLKYPVVFSDEPRRQPLPHQALPNGGRARAVNGTISYLPALFGMMIAGEIVKHLLSETS